jgi:hypothetical protein
MQPRKMIFNMQPYGDQTKWNKEENLIFFWKWKTTYIFFDGDEPNYFQMEDDLNIVVNGRQPHFLFKWKMTSIFLLMEDNLYKCPKTINLTLNK